MSVRSHRNGSRPVQVQQVDYAGRVPPHNADAEAAVISATLLDGEVLDRVDFLRTEDFYSEAHRRIFEGAREVKSAGSPVDIQTVAAWLKDRDWLHAIGGVAMLAKIVDATPSVAHVEAHAQIVKDKSTVRSLITECQRISAEGYLDYGEASEFVDAAERRVCAVGEGTHVSRETPAYDLMISEFKRIDRVRAAGGVDGDALTTGLTAVDEVLAGGHRGGELVVVAARPGMGKTAYMLGLALACADRGKVALIFSLEMPKEQLATRLLGTRARVDVRDLRKGDVRGEDWDRLMYAGKRISQLPILVDDNGSLTLSQLRSTSRRRAMKARQSGVKFGMIVVDYLQLMSGVGDENNREQVIAGISRGLKSLAKELGVPVVALSQLNRSVETRPGKDKRPQLSDLRESGAIEQDADVIQFLYRPEYYLANKHSDEAVKVKGYAEVIIAKQRNGPMGVSVPVTFLDTFAAFVDRDIGAPSYAGGES